MVWVDCAIVHSGFVLAKANKMVRPSFVWLFHGLQLIIMQSSPPVKTAPGASLLQAGETDKTDLIPPPGAGAGLGTEKRALAKENASPQSSVDEFSKLVGEEAEHDIKFRTLSWQKATLLLFGEYVCLAILALSWSWSVLGWVGGFFITFGLGLLTWCELFRCLIEIDASIGRGRRAARPWV